MALSQHLPEEILGQVLVVVQEVKNEWYRISLLNELADCLLGGELGQVLIAACAIRNKWYRAALLSYLSQPLIMCLPKKECYPYIELMVAQLALGTRADLFFDLAALMPVLVHLGTNDAPREIYKAVHDVTTWWP